MPLLSTRVSRPPQTGVEAILARGTSAFSQVLQNAIQTGRDVANNQARAERDFLNEQRREIDLRQRRSENARDAFENDRQFDESVRRFDTTQDFRERQFGEQVRANDLDRVLARVRINNDVAGLIEDSQDRRRDDARADRALTLQENREQRILKADQREVGLDSLRLQELQLRVQNAKTDAEREAAEAEQQRAIQALQGATVTELNSLIQDGNREGGVALFNERVNDPALGFDSSTRRSFARQLGLEDTSTSGSEDLDVDSLDFDGVERELGVIDEAITNDANEDSQASEKLRLRRSALERRRQDLRRATPEGRADSITGAAERGRQNRSFSGLITERR